MIDYFNLIPRVAQIGARHIMVVKRGINYLQFERHLLLQIGKHNFLLDNAIIYLNDISLIEKERFGERVVLWVGMRPTVPIGRNEIAPVIVHSVVEFVARLDYHVFQADSHTNPTLHLPDLHIGCYVGANLLLTLH